MTDKSRHSGHAPRRLPADLDGWRSIADSGGCCDGLAQGSLRDLLASRHDQHPVKGRRPPRPASEPAVLDSDAILAGSRKVAIRHRGDVYTLQVTRQGKLLLTK